MVKDKYPNQALIRQDIEEIVGRVVGEIMSEALQLIDARFIAQHKEFKTDIKAAKDELKTEFKADNKKLRIEFQNYAKHNDKRVNDTNKLTLLNTADVRVLQAKPA